MNEFWTNLKKNFEEGVKKISTKTEELTQIGRLKIEIIAVKRDIEKSFIELGGRIYHQVEKNSAYDMKADETIQDLIKAIKKLETKMKKLEKDIANIQSTGSVGLKKEEQK